MDIKTKKSKPISRGAFIKRIVHVEVTPQGRVERELTPEEVEQWKRDHGYNTENKTESDTK